MKAFFQKAQDKISFETHAAGAVLALIGAFFYLLRAWQRGSSPAALAAALCFCFSMVALYSASAIYHYYPGDTTSMGCKRRLRKLDHSMIYVLIAGSYTPFSLALLPSPKGKYFCLILWGIALLGIGVKLLWLNAPRALATFLYLAMGWAIVFVIRDFTLTSLPFLVLLAVGGLFYSVGALLYLIKKPNLPGGWGFHELFHLFILAGSLCHYVAVYLFLL